MNRRIFLKKSALLALLSFEIKHAFNGLIAAVFSSRANDNSPESLTIKVDNKTTITIPILWRNGMAYLSTVKFARGLQYHTYFNDDKKKIVLYLPKNKVVVTASNAFVVVDDLTYQMPAPAIWEQGEIQVPARYFLPLLERRTSLSLDYDESRQQLRITEKDINITDVTISSRENGTLIRIKTLKTFKEGEVTADMRYGWLHVDIYTGKIDKERIDKTRPAGLVSRIKTFQFAELASLAFFLRAEPLSREIIHNPDNNEILVVLRTDEELPDDEMKKDEDEFAEESEPSDEVKRQLEEERSKWLIDVIVIDAGHGGKDPGTISRDKKTMEKDIVLAVALKLGKIIEKEIPEVKVVYTRDSDKFIPLQKRTKIANEHNGKVFISIHANSIDNRRASGFETYILGPEKGDQARSVVLKENEVIKFEDAATRQEYKGINTILATMAQNAFSRQSEYLAGLVQQGLDKQMQSLDLKNRGVKQGPFWVLVGATMPNILVETGFLSNSYDLKVLKTASYQYKIARGIFDGLQRYKTDYESTI
jgi:N-acetylmuramoyl-L-alanine amidase